MKILKDETYRNLMEKHEAAVKELQLAKEKIIQINNEPTVISPGASSSKDIPLQGLALIQRSLSYLEPEFDFNVIPWIRKLTKVNPDMSQALNDITRLANTGHRVIFDPSVGPDQIDKMRDFLLKSSKNWHVGASGINGIINKMFRQIQTGGAISMEWVPNMNLDNLEIVQFVNPESIRFVVDKNNARYHPYQKLKNAHLTDISRQLKKLNTNQYKYIALNGDTDLPYGIPPFLPALDAISTQRVMIDNMKYIVETLGVLGYIDAKIAKPTKNPSESDDAYASRLNKLLTDFKTRIQQGMRDGASVGFMDDHEFDFKQTAKDARGAKDLFEQNELMVASGLGYDAAFMGRPGSTETLVTILFTKMIAQLKNLQDLVADNLEFGYALALTLAGFKFKSLSIQFNRSTLTDELKGQQGIEIKIRNLNELFDQGIISQNQYADEMGYIKPDQAEPRVTRDPLAINEAKAKDSKEAKKDASDRKGRDKKNPQGTTRGPRSAKAKAIAKKLETTGYSFYIGVN